MAFLSDITTHLNDLNLQLQGRDHWSLICMMQWRHFKWSCAYGRHKCTNATCLTFLVAKQCWTKSTLWCFPMHTAERLSLLRVEFARRFSDFEAQKSNFELFRNPFAIDVETAPVNLQMELIELQCNGTLKAKYDTVGPAQFTRFIPEEMPQLRLHAARTLSMFGSTYICVSSCFLWWRLTKHHTGVVSLMNTCSSSWESQWHRTLLPT